MPNLFEWPRRILWLDLESFSHDNLPKVGSWNYSRHPSTALSLFSGAFDDGIPFVLDEDQFAKATHIHDALADPEITKVAWNAPFDWQIVTNSLGIESPQHQWLDAMCLAASCGLPLALEKCGAAVGLDEDDRKHRDGRRLINLFSKPGPKGVRRDRHSHPDDWAKWVAYGMQDVISMRVILDRLAPYLKYTFTAQEYAVYLADQRINRMGVPLDLEHCHNAVSLYAEYTKLRLEEGRQITGLENPKAPAQLHGWLKSHGIQIDNMRAETLRNLLEDKTLLAPIRDAIQIRLELSRSSVAKFEQMLGKAEPGSGRLYDFAQYYGAHTGRWAGRGVQLHNLPRGDLKGDTPEEILNQQEAIRWFVSSGDYQSLRFMYGDVGAAISATVRSTLAAPEGQTYVVSDYSGVETATIAWLAGCERLLNMFRTGRDPYKDFASVLSGQPYDLITKAERNYAKPATLGCVFMLGAQGYQNYAQTFGQEVAFDEAKRIVDTFRATYPEIPAFWEQLKHAMTTVMKGHAGMRMPAGDHITFYKEDDRFLFAELPSGRSLAYPVPRLSMEETQWGRREQFSYMAYKDYQWMRVTSHPGKLAENMTQAVARDLLARALVMTTTVGLESVLHVHDEIVVLADEDQAESTQQTLEQLMTVVPSWAQGLPIGVDSFIANRYVKL
jgi:DNA polymerase